MPFIIAEIGVNFRDIREAKRMIGLAKQAGADAVKFQVYNKENLYKIFSGGDVLRDPKCKQLMEIMLDKDKLQHLKNVADDAGIEFIATPMFREAVEWLNDIGVNRFKIRYADRRNTTLIKKAMDTGKQVIISCDYTYPKEMMIGLAKQAGADAVKFHAYEALISLGDDFSLMYCIPEYPPRNIVLPLTFSVFTGYSNHFPSIVPPLVAAARGCQILEVHVKLGIQQIDDAVSITFAELRELVRLVREMEDVVR